MGEKNRKRMEHARFLDKFGYSAHAGMPKLRTSGGLWATHHGIFSKKFY